MTSVREILLNFGQDLDEYFNKIYPRSLINHFNDRLSAPPSGSSSSLIGFYEQLLKASKSGEYINTVPKTFLELMENFKPAVKKRVAVILEAGLFAARENPAVSMASTTQVVLAPLAEAHISSRPTSRSRSSDSEARSQSRDRSRSRDRARDRYRSPPRTKLDCSLCGRSNHSREQCYLKSHPQANHEDVPWRESKTGKRLRRLNYKTLPNRTALDASGRWVEWSRENHTPLRDSSRHNDNRTNADRESSYKPSRPIDNERGSDRESHRDPRRIDNLKDRDVSFTTDAFNATLNLAINASFPYNSVAPRPILSGTQRGARIKDSFVTLCDCGSLRANFITRNCNLSEAFFYRYTLSCSSLPLSIRNYSR